MAPNEQYLLAIVGGLAFGTLWRLFLPKVGLGLLVVVLVTFWALQTFLQQAYRISVDLSDWPEVWQVTSLRIAFGVAALAAAWLVGRWRGA